MRAVFAGLVVLVGCILAGCTQETGPNPTVPPIRPTHQISGSVLPVKAGGYTVLGQAPVAGQTTATYVRDTTVLDLAVATFDETGDLGQVSLDEQQWYGASRCGILWQRDSDATDAPMQAACVTVLADGVMTTVAGGSQSAAELSELANAIYATLA